MKQSSPDLNRRTFLKQTGMATAGVGLGSSLLASPGPVKAKNSLPAWRGFNLLDFFAPDPKHSRKPTPEEHLKWMADWGFDFVRIPMAYPYYLDIDRSRNIRPEEVYRINPQAVETIEKLVDKAHRYQLHVSLNLHRTPGYCINAGFHEPYNLWTDQQALDAFCFHWEFWAKRYRHTSSQKISFDLVNEPSMRADMNDQHSRRSSVPGETYRRVAKAAADTIRRVNPQHLVIADGNDGGANVIPEIADLAIAQSCRGYYPGIISHYKAPWANQNPEALPPPVWPGTMEMQEVNPETGVTVSKALTLNRTMLEQFYQPWLDLMAQGVGIHCGECGCWNKTPHTVFLAWFADVLDILTQNGIGYGIWEFSGDFGLLDSGRDDVAYENWYGHQLDRKMLDLLLRMR